MFHQRFNAEGNAVPSNSDLTSVMSADDWTLRNEKPALPNDMSYMMTGTMHSYAMRPT